MEALQLLLKRSFEMGFAYLSRWRFVAFLKNMLLSAFGGVAAFVEEKFRDGIRIFVKVEICLDLINIVKV